MMYNGLFRACMLYHSLAKEAIVAHNLLAVAAPAGYQQSI